MHCSLLLAFSSVLPLITAELTCIDWVIVNPIIGAVCAYRPPISEDDQWESTTAVETVVSDLSFLGDFRLTYSASTLEFNLAGADNNSVSVNSSQTDRDAFAKVTIGADATIADAGTATLLEWGLWLDFWQCTIEAAITRRKDLIEAIDPAVLHLRVGSLDQTAAAGVIQSCKSLYIDTLPAPIVLENVKAEQKLETTVSSVASLLSPVYSDLGYGLAIDGIDGSRILRWDPEQGEGFGTGFASEEDALSVRDSLQTDEQYLAANCTVCNEEPDTGSQLTRRGSTFSLCCRASSPPRQPPQPPQPPIGTAEDLGATSGSGADQGSSSSQRPNAGHNWRSVRSWGAEKPRGRTWNENFVVQPPSKTWQTIYWDKYSSECPAHLKRDLLDFRSARVAWSEEMLLSYSSDRLFSKLRKVYRQGRSGSFWKQLAIYIDTDVRAKSRDAYWRPDADDKEFAMFLGFAKTAMRWATDITRQSFPKALKDKEIHADMHIFWMGNQNYKNNAISEHVDDMLLVFSAADEAGLIIQPRDGAALWRAKPIRNTFQVMAGEQLELISHEDSDGKMTLYPSHHAIWGETGMFDAFGRVSVILTTYLNKKR